LPENVATAKELFEYIIVLPTIVTTALTLNALDVIAVVLLVMLTSGPFKLVDIAGVTVKTLGVMMTFVIDALPVTVIIGVTPLWNTVLDIMFSVLGDPGVPPENPVFT
jgi:hypothetical protein